MNHKGLKLVLFASVVLAAFGMLAPAANAGWWWGAAPSYCGCDSCCGGFYGGGCGCGWHHHCHYGWGGGCGCGCGCYGGCWTPWSCCGSCYSTWMPSCCDCGCGGVAMSSCGCGGVTGVVTGEGTVIPPATAPKPPVAPATPAAPSLAPSNTGAVPPVTPPSGTAPSLSTPTVPEGGGGLLPPGHGASLDSVREDSCILTIWVPYDAKVTINGLPTKSTGSRRQFVSYGLQPGYTYTYEVTASIDQERPWSRETAYTVGQVVRSGASTGDFFVCTVAGKSGTDTPPPTWVGQTFTDGSVTWKNVGSNYRGPGYKGMVVKSTQTVALTAGGREGVAFGFNTTPPASGVASNY